MSTLQIVAKWRITEAWHQVALETYYPLKSIVRFAPNIVKDLYHTCHSPTPLQVLGAAASFSGLSSSPDVAGLWVLVEPPHTGVCTAAGACMQKVAMTSPSAMMLS